MALPLALTLVGAAWSSAYILITWMALPRLTTDFYGGMPAPVVRAKQSSLGVKAVAGATCVHLAWLADPEREHYRVYSASRRHRPSQASADDPTSPKVQLAASPRQWELVDETSFGSSLIKGLSPQSRHRFKVVSVTRDDSTERTLGVAEATTSEAAAPFERPVIASPWRPLFRPHRAGDYVNDHCLFRDAGGCWRLWGITGPGRGDYSREKRFAQGLLPCAGNPDANPDPAASLNPDPNPDPGARFNPDADSASGARLDTTATVDMSPGLDSGEMIEIEPVADYSETAWAPHVIRGPGGVYHAFWSPHRAPHAVSEDGVTWRRVDDAIERPYGWFFRDPMLLQVAPGQWLMYVSARGWYFSRVDVYQSFDLDNWQFIRSAWTSSWGSERNAIVGSAESPFVIARNGNYYLSITYNNESGLLAPIALALGYWTGSAASYNDTLVFASDNPYEFGEYRGSRVINDTNRGPAGTPGSHANAPGNPYAPGNHADSSAGNPYEPDGSIVPIARLEAHAPEYVYDAPGGDWHITSCGWPLAATLSTGEVAIARLRWETN